MERYQRKTPPDVVKAMWTAIRNCNGMEMEHTRLVKQLQKEHPSDHIESYVTNAVVDGLIQVVDKPKKPKPKSVYHYTLPDVTDFQFPDDHPDVYCYECHLEGTVLKCSDCVRVFHRDCVKTMTEKYRELESFISKYKRVNISEFGGIANGVSNRPATSSPVSVADSSSSPLPVDGNETRSSVGTRTTTVKSELNQPASVKQEDNDFKPELDDAQFVGIVRPADRRLEERMNTPSVKPEDNGSSVMDSDEFLYKYCYPCRQIRGNQYNTPPNMSQAELNYLLRFLFDQYKSWIPDDTYSPDKQSSSVDIVENMELCQKLLIRLPKSLDTIEQKLKQTEYQTLEEFSADIHDIAHNMAIIHGVNSIEFNAVMYFVTDCVYDLYEIRQCPDCFRHSNEKAETDWFARPCVTRHELVYAKMKGYQYWPAKVIRVFNNKYDVRFFGDRHSRAVVDSGSVKPIDSDFEVLKINPKKSGFQKAMQELHKHQALVSLPKDYYSYGSHPTTPINVLLRSMPTNFSATPPSTSAGKKRRGRKPRALVSKPPAEAVNITPVPDNLSMESLQAATPTTPQRDTFSTQNGGSEKRQTRQTDKRPAEVTCNNLSPPPSKKTRLESDINGSCSSSTMTSTLTSEASSATAGPSDESLLQRSPRIKAQLKHKLPDDVVKLQALLDKMDDIDKVKELAVTALEEDIKRWKQKIRALLAEYNSRISDIKKKQWCKHCEHESILYCCWNTSYCSRECQVKDWPNHKRSHKYAKS